MHVLVIENNAYVASRMFDYLEAKGHILDAARDGLTGLHLALGNRYDAIVLDLELPGIDGITLCRKLRAKDIKTPILIITASNSLRDKIAGLEAGGDDYLTKPAELREVETRLRVLHRRGNGNHFQKQKRMMVEDLILDPCTYSVRRGEKAINLPRIPYKILETLMERSPRVVNRSDLEHSVWGDGHPDSNSLKSHVHLLREQIDKPFEQKLIRTIRGFGYQLAGPEVQKQY